MVSEEVKEATIVPWHQSNKVKLSEVDYIFPDSGSTEFLLFTAYYK